MKKFRNIIFDFGGVLYNIRYQNIADAFARYGFADFDKLYSKAHQTEVFDLFEEGKMSIPDFCDQIRFMSQKDLTDNQIAECWNAILIDFGISKNYDDDLFRILEDTKKYDIIHFNEQRGDRSVRC